MGFEEQLKNVVAFIPSTTILSVGVAGTGADAEGVPEDHLRYVYFAKYWNQGGESIVSVYESLAGVLALKDQQRLTANQTLQNPQAGPAGGVPVAVFRGSSFIRIQLSGGGGTTSGAGVNLLILDKPGGGGA